MKRQHHFILSTILLVMFFLLIKAFGHGEDKPGPHQGIIRMPGAFHTEVLNEKDQGFRIYLLDIHWKNPSVSHSKVDVWVLQNKKKTPLKCIKEKDSFLCLNENKIDFLSKSKMKLEIIANREGKQGNAVIYDLPLHSE